MDSLTSWSNVKLSLKQQAHKPALFATSASELQLHNSGFKELMKTVLEKDMPFRFRVEGISMMPFIREGDVITIVNLNSGYTRIGAVVAYTHPESGKLMVHRVIGRKQGSYSIKGDHSKTATISVPAGNVHGVVNLVERDGEKVEFGIGMERFLIALLSSECRLSSLLSPLWRFFRRLIWRMAR